MTAALRGLYAITDTPLLAGGKLLPYAEAALIGGAHLGRLGDVAGHGKALHLGHVAVEYRDLGALPGITRAAVIDIAKELGIPLAERDLSRHDIYTCDECFLTGTAAEVIPVIEVDARKIGTGKPGPITASILAEFRKKASREGQMIR